MNTKDSGMETPATKSETLPTRQAELVTDSGFCDLCGDQHVPIYAGMDDDTGEWIGICAECLREIQEREACPPSDIPTTAPTLTQNL